MTSHELSQESPLLTWFAQADPSGYALAIAALERYRAFRIEQIAPVAKQLEEELRRGETRLQDALLSEAARAGLFSLAFPKAVGGGGAPVLGMLLGLEELAAGCTGIANLLTVHGLALAVMGACGAVGPLVDCCRRIVTAEKLGQVYLLSTAVTEPSAGTDWEHFDLLPEARFSARATRVEGGYLLDGTKVFISNGSLAEQHVVVMVTDPTQPTTSAMAFLVDASNPGLSVGRTEDKMGQTACPAAELVFERCFVPDSEVLGAFGAKELDLVLGASRAAVAAYGAGIARANWEWVLGRLQDSGAANGWEKLAAGELRRQVDVARASYLAAGAAGGQFGLPALLGGHWTRQLQSWLPASLLDRPSLRHFLSSPAIKRATQLALEWLTRRSVEVAASHAAAAKITASELAWESCRLTLSLSGARGLLLSEGLEKRLRDSRLLSIYEGTNDLNRLELVAKWGHVRVDSPPPARPALALSPALPHSADAARFVKQVGEWARQRQAQRASQGGRYGEDTFTQLEELGLTATVTGAAQTAEATEEQRLLLDGLRALASVDAALAVEWLARRVAARLALGATPTAGNPWRGTPLFADGLVPATLRWEQNGLRGSVLALPGSPRGGWFVLPARNSAGQLRLVAAELPESKTTPLLGLDGCAVGSAESFGTTQQVLASGDAARATLDAALLATLPEAIALCLGVVDASFSAAQEYASQRHQGGRLLADHPSVRQRLAQTEAARVRAESLLEPWSGSPAALSGRLAAFVATRRDLVEAVDLCFAVLGGYAYVSELGMSRRLREALCLSLLLGREGELLGGLAP